MISIHAPRGGSDWLEAEYVKTMGKEFQSTLPVGGATPSSIIAEQLFGISIHAPRGGSDKTSLVQYRRKLVISIHAPRGGSDHNLSLGRITS